MNTSLPSLLRATTCIGLLIPLMPIGTIQAQQTVIWSENWEGNWSADWYVDNGVWQVGLPTNPDAPDSAFAGTACAAIGLNSGSNISATTRIVTIGSIPIPSANDYPRLRFWHWFALGNVSGRVQVKTATGVWTNVTTYSYSQSCSDVWSVDEIDLSAWADSAVQVALLFQSTGGNGWEGWYVDDLSIVTGPFAYLNPEGFENGYGDWSVERGTWEIGQATGGPMDCHTGNGCAAIKLAGFPADGVATRLRSTWFTVPSLGLSPGISFWHWFSLGPNANPHVEIRTRNMTSWQTISTVFSGSSVTWTPYYTPLSDWADSTVQICFYFSSTGGNSYPGWWIDDLSINGLDTTVDVGENEGGSPLFRIFPNPSSGSFTIAVNAPLASANASLLVYDMFGRICFAEKLSPGSTDLITVSSLAAGVYNVHIADGTVVLQEKVVVESR